MKSSNIFIVLVLYLASVASGAWAASTTIRASKDNSIFRNRASNSAGGAAGVFAGTTATGSPRRGLIAFDVAGNVPTGATITSVELTLYLGMSAGGDSKPVGLHRLTKDWGEGTAGSHLPTVRNAGMGFEAAPGDATWNANFFGASLWSGPGAAGDFNPAASSTTMVNDAVDTPFIWSSTPALIGDAQSWLDSPATNFGWALINGDELSLGTARAFYSREATVDAGGDPMDLARRPVLTIHYIPEPNSMILLLLCGSAATNRRGHRVRSRLGRN
jgi:hypothetical protein